MSESNEIPDPPVDEPVSETNEPTEKPAAKTVPLAEHIALRKRAKESEAKLAEFEAKEAERQRAEMSEIERYKADAEAAQKELGKLREGQRKSEALNKAVSEIGEGWTVEHALKELSETVKDLSYDEATIDQRVKRMVEIAKRQKVAEGLPIRGTPSNQQPTQDPSRKMTPFEMAQSIMASKN